MVITARRLIASFVLLILACNAWVIASPLNNTASAGNQPVTLLSLKHESVGSTTRILIESSAPPLYTVTRQSDTLIVIDLGAEASRLAPSYAVKSPVVGAVNVRSVGSKALAGQSRTNIEIAVHEGVKDSSRTEGNTLI